MRVTKLFRLVPFAFCFSFCVRSVAFLDLDEIISTIETENDMTALALPGIAQLSLPHRVLDILDSILIGGADVVLLNSGVQVNTTASVGWTDLDVQINMKEEADRGVDVVIMVSIPDDWKISSLIPKLNKLDIFTYKNTKLVISNYDHIDDLHDIEIKKGANLFGMLSLTGPLQYVSWFIGNTFGEILFSGLIKREIVGSSFTAQLPGKINLLGDLSAQDLKFVISIGETLFSTNEPLCSIDSNIVFNAPGQEKLVFRSEFEFLPSAVEFYGSIDGMIKNIFGVDGLHAGNCFLGGTADYASMGNFMPVIPFSDLAMGFDLEIAGKKVQMIGRLGFPGETGIGDLAFEGVLEGGLSLSDCIDFVDNLINESVSIPREVDDFQRHTGGYVPDFALGDVHVFFSPKDVVIDGKSYTKGLIFDGKAEIFGSDAHIFVDIQEVGMRLLGYLEEMKFGPVIITGPGYDRIMDTPDDGIILDAQLGLDKQYCFIAGNVEIDIFGGISSKTKIDVTADGLTFNIEKKLFDMFDCGLLFNSKMSDDNMPTDFYVRGHMYQTALTELQNLLSKTAYRMAQKKKSVCDTITGWYNGFWNVLANIVGNTFNIKEFSFESSLDKLIGQTELPCVTVKGIIFGKEFELNDLTFDLSNPIESAQEIIQQVSVLFD